MRLLAKSFLVAWLVVGLAYLPIVQADSYVPDTGQSTRLTDYLHSHRLPLVGAQVLSSDTGGRTVLLYGYTATSFGKEDAEAKTRRFLKDAGVSITNRIRIRPELLTMKSPAPAPEAASPPPVSGNMGDANSYENQQAQDAQQQYLNQQAGQYMNQGSSASSWASTLIPLIGMGLAIGLGGSGSGFGMGVSPGMGGSFGNSYGNYGNPYGGSGNPYGGYSNPYGTTPNPYGPGSTGTYP